MRIRFMSSLIVLIIWVTVPVLELDRFDAARSPATASDRIDRTDSMSDLPLEPSDPETEEVVPAVATYTVDHSGTLVEVHSPRTEVPRLRPPST
ncbi:MAG: hypothetical protein HY654_13525 [Acidobacteria bacterium]|nr:hypothetical protein [Acidobacteriota bacterium]